MSNLNTIHTIIIWTVGSNMIPFFRLFRHILHVCRSCNYDEKEQWLIYASPNQKELNGYNQRFAIL